LARLLACLVAVLVRVLLVAAVRRVAALVRSAVASLKPAWLTLRPTSRRMGPVLSLLQTWRPPWQAFRRSARPGLVLLAWVLLAAALVALQQAHLLMVSGPLKPALVHRLSSWAPLVARWRARAQ
jgi:hypothetical protein